MTTTSHDAVIPAAEAGCLLVADISGYTTYLRDNELEHANDVLADLIETVVGHLAPTFRIGKLEGDAVFAYALEDEIGAAMFLDTIDDTYFAFRSRRRNIKQATVCDCNACRTIPSLDLKFIAHHGRFVRSPIAGDEELTGSDVVVVHRLLKNTVTTTSGLVSYALITEACRAALDIDPVPLGMVAHHESLADFGEVVGYIIDLDSRWESLEEARRVYVDHEEAQFEFVDRLPAAPPVVWEAYTSPHRRLAWQTDFVHIDQDNPTGRPGAGTVNHCMHGKGVIVEEILDWRPFRYYTYQVAVPMIGPWTMTVELVDSGDGSTATSLRALRLHGRRRLVWILMKRFMMANIQANGRRLRQLLEEEARVGAHAGQLTD